MDYWSPKHVELLNVMNEISQQILCILLDYGYIAKWYTVHTISDPRISLLVVCSYTAFPYTWLRQFAILCLTPSNLLNLSLQHAMTLTKHLTARSTGPMWKLTFPHAVKKFLAFHGFRRFIIVLTKALFRAMWIQPISSHPILTSVFNCTHPSKPFSPSYLVFHRKNT